MTSRSASTSSSTTARRPRSAAIRTARSSPSTRTRSWPTSTCCARTASSRARTSTVYSLEKGGQKLDKGVIEVIEVRENVSSKCAILKTYDPGFPLKPGDKIYNELYEGGRARHIAFAGRFSGRLSNEEAANLIRAFGDVYQDKVDENTNYVVVAEGYEEHPNYKASQEYGIKVLREKILYDYLGVRRE